jgi:pimeloyl-ACP methyl ester carboxylesterase
MTPESAVDPRRTVSTDGTPIAYWTTGSGPPVLLVHGAMSDHRRWRITPILSAAHRTVHAMDRRGRGGSGDAPTWSLDQEVADVRAVIDAIAADAGTEVDVLGHSLGGLLALRAAARNPHVRRLVLYEPAVVEGRQPPAVVARMQAALDDGRPHDAVLVMMREVVRMPEDEIAAMQSLPSWSARVEAAPTLPREMSVDLTWDAREGPNVTAPTLVILGGDSPAFMVDAAHRVVEAVPGAALAVIEGQQHVADLIQPDQFAEIVLGFLRA